MSHVFLTRFNLPSAGTESLIRADENWLRERIELFEHYTIPSVRHQTIRSAGWLIYLDPDSPTWLRERMDPLEAEGLGTLKYYVPGSSAAVVEDVRALVPPVTQCVVTSNLDNDDGLAIDFVERLLYSATSTTTVIYFVHGIIMRGNRLYLHKDRDNAFVAVSEPLDSMVSCWADWHNRLRLQMPALELTGEPAWLQIVHGKNVSNRVRGHLTDPTDYQRLFPGLIAGVMPPPKLNALASRMIAAPSRHLRDQCRRMTARTLTRIGGKDAVDAVKYQIWRLALRRDKRPKRTRIRRS